MRPHDSVECLINPFIEWNYSAVSDTVLNQPQSYTNLFKRTLAVCETGERAAVRQTETDGIHWRLTDIVHAKGFAQRAHVAFNRVNTDKAQMAGFAPDTLPQRNILRAERINQNRQPERLLGCQCNKVGRLGGRVQEDGR